MQDCPIAGSSTYISATPVLLRTIVVLLVLSVQGTRHGLPSYDSGCIVVGCTSIPGCTRTLEDMSSVTCRTQSLPKAAHLRVSFTEGQ